MYQFPRMIIRLGVALSLLLSLFWVIILINDNVTLNNLGHNRFRPKYYGVNSVSFIRANHSRWEDPLNKCQHRIVNSGWPISSKLECAISFNGGGQIIAFKYAAMTAESRFPGGVRIEGECASACTLFADMARKMVCITPQAIMKFHQSSDGEYGIKLGYSDEVAKWVGTHGGWPSMTADHLTEMSFPETLRFWRLCDA